MTEPFFKIRTEALDRGGSYSEADQGAALQHARFQGLAAADRSGVCWEVCRRWVRRRFGLDGGWTRDDTIYDLIPAHADAMAELIEAHEQRNRAGVAENYEIDGLFTTGPTRRQYARFLFITGAAQNLESRDAVIDAILEPRGVYIFNFYRNGGHAVAFDTRGGADGLLFMDPNTGEMSIPTHAEDEFRSFFSGYWGHFYKDDYHRGQRELTRYELP